jgi:hypothetical protein
LSTLLCREKGFFGENLLFLLEKVDATRKIKTNSKKKVKTTPSAKKRSKMK